MRIRTKILLLTTAAILSLLLFLFYKLGANWEYALPRRGMKVVAMTIAGSCIAISTVIFQTVTHNRILTPSIMGLDSLYLLVQTLLIFLIGGREFTSLTNEFQFLISIGVMICFALLLYRAVLSREGRPVYFLLLVGIILGTLFQSLASFMQILIDPNEFLLIQDKMFASFNNVQTRLIWLSLGIMALTALLYWPTVKFLDVLTLGRDQAINLGVMYDKVIQRSLIVVAVLTALATALVGPITFLGLLVANLAYEILRTYRHRILILGATLISIIALAGGQMLVERLFTFSTTLSVIINFIGGVYFIYLLLRENRSW